MRRYIIATSIALILLCASPNTHHPLSDEDPLDVKSVPPTFITLDHIPECVSSGPFPQTNPLPYFENATHVQFSCEFYEKDHVSWVVYIFYEMWEKEFGDPHNKLRSALDQITIEWGEDIKNVNNVYDIDGNFIQSSPVAGLMINGTIVWVWADGPHISSTALVHELTHIALHHLCGDADPDHEGIKYLCWDKRHSTFIDAVNSMLRDTYGI